MSRLSKDYMELCLHRSVCAVVFKKKSTGTLRAMMCTLNPDHIPLHVTKPQYRVQTLRTLLVVWDLERLDWRAFHDYSVLKFQVSPWQTSTVADLTVQPSRQVDPTPVTKRPAWSPKPHSDVQASPAVQIPVDAHEHLNTIRPNPITPLASDQEEVRPVSGINLGPLSENGGNPLPLRGKFSSKKGILGKLSVGGKIRALLLTAILLWLMLVLLFFLSGMNPVLLKTVEESGTDMSLYGQAVLASLPSALTS